MRKKNHGKKKEKKRKIRKIIEMTELQNRKSGQSASLYFEYVSA